MRRCWILVLLLESLLGLSPKLAAQANHGGQSGRAAPSDWPQWRGPTRDGRAGPASELPANLPKEARILWKTNAGAGLASPVVADGQAFLFDSSEGKETLHALEAASGREQWRAAVDESFQDEQGPPGPRCTPLVDGERIYVQSCRGELQCRRVRDGRLVWHTHFQKDFGAVLLGEDSKVPGAAEHGYTASPLIVGTQLVACVGGTNQAGIVSFDQQTGRVLWRSQSDLASYAAPILATLAGVEQIVCFTVEGVIGLSPQDGQLLWRVPLKTSYGRNVTTPVTVRDWVIVGSYQAGLVGIQIAAAPAPGMLKAERKWATKTAAMNFSSPVAVGGYVYGLGPARNLICVEVESGRVLWSKEGLWSTSADAAYGAFVVYGGQLLISNDTGELILAAVSPAGCGALARMQVCGKNWCSPAVAGGRAYLRDGLGKSGHWYCVALVEPWDPLR